MRHPLLVAVTVVLLGGVAAALPGRWGEHQEVPRLTWLTPGFLPPDGLLTVGVGGSSYTPGYDPTGSPAEYAVTQLRVFAHWTPLPAIALSWGQNYRSWADFQAPSVAALTGGGLADGDWRLAAAVPRLPRWMGLSVWGGGNIPVGGPELGEDALSTEAGATLSLALWRTSQLPEMRLHASVGRRWNGNEEFGYGAGLAAGPQPWYPQYPDAASSGGDANNDMRLWGVALEFRGGTTALWLEYTAQHLWRAEQIRSREDQKILAAGLRWGLAEGWAAHADFQVGFQKDDLGSSWYPSQPARGTTIAVSRQFGLGGRDGDHDGVPDRRDACPLEAEDRDGFQDDDGCPERDNDGDGIPDTLDEAPNEPEDFDGYLDSDGMPEWDNDGDGIPDARDFCPNEAEDFDGYKDQDGCPEEFIDTDGDGIADEDDLCPSGVEDRDGFQDADGCPDPDNDLDGVADDQDECPDEPEDYDGDEDGDGCPDVEETEETEEGQEKPESATAAEAASPESPRPRPDGRR